MDKASQSQKKRRNPSFFKILIQDFSTRLQIPAAFNKVFGKEVPKKAILETYFSKSEEVEVERHENRFCLCKGWSKFVEENKLEIGDFLVFKYVSDCSKFKVKIYGKTCCEKEYCYHSDVAGHKCTSETGENDEDQRNNNSNNVEDGPKRKREGEEKEQQEDNIVKNFGASKSAKRIETDSESDIGDEASEDELIDLDSESSHPMAEEEVGNSKQRATIEEKENGESERLHLDDQIEFKPQNPFFQVKLKSSAINGYLNIPLSFSRKYMKGSERQDIKVEMADNKVWEVGLLVLWVGGGRKKELAGVRLSQGWRNLVSEYNLQMADLCIFELIRQTHDLVFLLHVFRSDAQTNKFIRIL